MTWHGMPCVSAWPAGVVGTEVLHHDVSKNPLEQRASASLVIESLAGSPHSNDRNIFCVQMLMVSLLRPARCQPRKLEYQRIKTKLWRKKEEMGRDIMYRHSVSVGVFSFSLRQDFSQGLYSNPAVFCRVWDASKWRYWVLHPRPAFPRSQASRSNFKPIIV